MKEPDIKKLEFDLLISGIYQRYGYDFSHYAQDSLQRRLCHFLERMGFQHLSDMLPKVLYEPAFFSAMLKEIAVSVTEMFRDPPFFLEFRKRIVTLLKTHPFIKIWHAGCATGEEVYSMAVLLLEENLLDRVTIYATDFSDYALSRAREGVYSTNDMLRHQQNYQLAGGQGSLEDYYHCKYNFIKMNEKLKKNILFAKHNLACDGVFSEIHVVLCRNVLIYFDKTLQNQVVQTFFSSLIDGGFLCLGTSETIEFLDLKDRFAIFSKQNKIFQKSFSR